jgi:serine protease Do
MRQIIPRSLVVAAALLVATAAVAEDAWLGITMSEISPGMARALQLDDDGGVLVDTVVPDSPAAAAGLEPGDVVVGIGDRTVDDSGDLARRVRRHDAGDRVVLTVLRDGERRELTVTLGERPARDRVIWSFGKGEHGERSLRWEDEDGKAGMILDGFGLGDDRGYLGVIPGPDDEEPGVVITAVNAGGAAAEAGLEDGDRIVAIDGEEIGDGADLHRRLEGTEPGQEVTVTVVRDGERREMAVTLAASPGRIDLSAQVRRFLPEGMELPGQLPWIELHGGDLEHLDSLNLRDERAELRELKRELEQLQRELERLQRELAEKSPPER